MGWVLLGVPLLVGLVYYSMRHRQIHAQSTAIEKYAVES
jgi:hypothetical protein